MQWIILRVAYHIEELSTLQPWYTSGIPECRYACSNEIVCSVLPIEIVSQINHVLLRVLPMKETSTSILYYMYSYIYMRVCVVLVIL